MHEVAFGREIRSRRLRDPLICPGPQALDGSENFFDSLIV